MKLIEYKKVEGDFEVVKSTARVQNLVYNTIHGEQEVADDKEIHEDWVKGGL